MKPRHMMLLAVCLGGSAAAQNEIPDEFKNLKVLPPDITKQELVKTMKGFALGLGVRCSHCHVGEEGQPLSTYDFPADDKETKRIARTMLKMVGDINGKYLDTIGRDERLTVACVTCHRGQPRPLMTVEALQEAYEDGGIDAAMERYADLRKEYFGTHTYDFSEDVLAEFAMTLARADDARGALRAFKLNHDLFPGSWSVNWRLAEGYANAGERDRAVAQMEKTLAMEGAAPFKDFLEKQLEEMRSGE